MRITIIAPGSRGDVEPYVALGKGLLAAGYAVRLVTHEDFGDLVTSHGLEFWPIRGQVQDIATSTAMRERIAQGNFLRLLAEMGRHAREGAEQVARAGLAACEDADIIVAGLAGLFTGVALAERFGRPLVQAHYIPLTPTSSRPSFVFAGVPLPSVGPLNRLSYHIARQMIWQPFRPADRIARTRVLGIPPAPFAGPFGSACMRGEPVLYGYSPLVIPRPADWPEEAQVTGYWLLDPAPDWRPSADLQAFLDVGDPPVYVGFGSMPSRDPRETADLVLGAVKRSGRRAIVLSGWDGMRPSHLPDSIYMLDGAPFDWLFPRMAAVVHHGGAGTTAAGLRAGVPTVVVPFFGDQPFWGGRVTALGVGPRPIPRKRLTEDRLAKAITTACGDDAMRRRAAALGAAIRAEDGVARAVSIIQARYPV